MSKLAAQRRARITLALCLIAPIIIVLALKGQTPPPKDSLFGRHIHDSGYAMPLLMLGFAGQWVLPLLTALVAGDIFASEDHHGTWKTVLTRSASRTQLFWAKTITAMSFAVAVPLLLTTPCDSWHGLMAQDRFYGPLVSGLVVAAVWALLCLGAAFFTLRHRDITEG
jgi:ABC-2 type transport system permease protein